jgi:hypothetical protein
VGAGTSAAGADAEGVGAGSIGGSSGWPERPTPGAKIDPEADGAGAAEADLLPAGAAPRFCWEAADRLEQE